MVRLSGIPAVLGCKHKEWWAGLCIEMLSNQCRWIDVWSPRQPAPTAKPFSMHRHRPATGHLRHRQGAATLDAQISRRKHLQLTHPESAQVQSASLSLARCRKILVNLISPTGLLWPCLCTFRYNGSSVEGTWIVLAWLGLACKQRSATCHGNTNENIAYLILSARKLGSAKKNTN